MDTKNIEDIRNYWISKSTDELLQIWKENNHEAWSNSVFEAARQILIERGVEIPPQNPAKVVESDKKNYNILDNNENIVVALVPDDPEQLYKHRNQIAAITDKRILFIRYKGISRSFEGSYTIESLDVDDVHEVKYTRRFAIGGLLVGAFLIIIAGVIGYKGLKFELIGPGVIFIPIIAGGAGIALILGVKRRVLTFKTAKTSYKWISSAMSFRETNQLVKRVGDHFRSRGVSTIGFEGVDN